MEAYSSKFLASLFFLLMILLNTSQIVQQNTSIKESSPSPFDFRKHLQHFEYLNDYYNYVGKDHDDFDDILGSTIKRYQINYHLNVNGSLDTNTVFAMTMPCHGVADFANGTERVRNHPRKSHGHHHHHQKASHYNFFSGNLKWPASKTHLTYAFYNNTNPLAMGAVTRAFNKWASATQYFSFSQVQNIEKADLEIGFFRGDHNDGHPFDGHGGVLAHASAPTHGILHFDADEDWIIGSFPGYMDVETVALHEIGHLLGLRHSSFKDSIMWPTLDLGKTKDLHTYDIEGIRVLYNIDS